MWAIIVCSAIAGMFIGSIGVFLFLYRKRDIGKKFFENSEKPYGKIAPSIYYYKQRIFRFAYGFFIVIHYILMLMSVSFTSLTIYMVMDRKISLYIRIFISVMAAITTTLQITLRFEKIAEGYIRAMRILEQAILEYEHREETQLDILLIANKKAEKIIHNMFH